MATADVQPRPTSDFDPATVTAGTAPTPAAAQPPATPLDDPAFQRLLAQSPTLRAQVDQFQRDGGTVRWGTAGGGTYIENNNAIVIDRNSLGDGPQLAQSMAHELGHYTFNEPQDLSTRETYVRGLLRDEAGATLNNARVRAEIVGNGGPDIGFPGQHAATYQQISERRLRGEITEEEALTQISDTFKTERTSTTNQTYEDYYGASYPGPGRARANEQQQEGAGPRATEGAGPRQTEGAGPRPTEGAGPRSTEGAGPRPTEGAGPRQVDVSSMSGATVEERLQNAVRTLGLTAVNTAQAVRTLADTLMADTLRNGGRAEDIKQLVTNADQSVLFGVKGSHQNYRIDLKEALGHDPQTARDALERAQDVLRQSDQQNLVREPAQPTR